MAEGGAIGGGVAEVGKKKPPLVAVLVKPGLQKQSSGEGLPGSNQKEVVLNVQLASNRVQRFLRREMSSPLWRWSGVSDARLRRDGRSSVKQNLGASLLGMLVGSRSLREVEELTLEAPGRGLFGVQERVPDTTLYRFLKRTAPSEVREFLVRQVRQFQRQGRLGSIWPLGQVQFF